MNSTSNEENLVTRRMTRSASQPERRENLLVPESVLLSSNSNDRYHRDSIFPSYEGTFPATSQPSMIKHHLSRMRSVMANSQEVNSSGIASSSNLKGKPASVHTLNDVKGDLEATTKIGGVSRGELEMPSIPLEDSSLRRNAYLLESNLQSASSILKRRSDNSVLKYAFPPVKELNAQPTAFFTGKEDAGRNDTQLEHAFPSKLSFVATPKTSPPTQSGDTHPTVGVQPHTSPLLHHQQPILTPQNFLSKTDLQAIRTPLRTIQLDKSYFRRSNLSGPPLSLEHLQVGVRTGSVKRKLEADSSTFSPSSSSQADLDIHRMNAFKRLKNLDGNVLKVQHNITTTWMDNLRKRVQNKSSILQMRGNRQLHAAGSGVCGGAGEDIKPPPSASSSSLSRLHSLRKTLGATAVTPAERCFDENLMDALSGRSLTIEETRELREKNEAARKEKEDNELKACSFKQEKQLPSAISSISSKSATAAAADKSLMPSSSALLALPRSLNIAPALYKDLPDSLNLQSTSRAKLKEPASNETASKYSSLFGSSGIISSSTSSSSSSMIFSASGSSLSGGIQAQKIEVSPTAKWKDEAHAKLSEALSISNEPEGGSGSKAPSYESLISSFGSAVDPIASTTPDNNIFVANFASGKKKKKGRGR